MTTALVTGASGFIGSHLVEELGDRGYRVRCLVRPTSNLRWLEGRDIEIARGAFENEASLRDAARDVDYVFHVGAAIRALRRRDFYRCNTEGTLRVASAALEAAPGLKRFLFVSSQSAAGPCAHAEQPTNETDECKPVSDYGKSKLRAEGRLRDLGARLPITIVRPPLVYGPRDTNTLVVIRMLNRRLCVFPGRTRQLSMIYVKDLVRGMVDAAESPRAVGRTYFLSEDKSNAVRELLSCISDELAKKALVVRLPRGLSYALALLFEAYAQVARHPTVFGRQTAREGAELYWVCSSEAAQRDFAFSCRYSLPAGLSETIAWYKELRIVN